MPGLSVKLVPPPTCSTEFLNRQPIEHAWLSHDQLQEKGDTQFATAVSSCGDRAVFVSTGGRAIGFDGEMGKIAWARKFPCGPAQEFPPAFSPSGNRIALADCDHHVCAIDAATGDLLWRTALSPHEPQKINSSPAFSPDGKLLSVGTKSGKIAILDSQTGLVKRELESGMDEMTSIAPVFSPDGKKVAATFWNDIDLRHHLVLFKLSSGEKLWNKVVYYGSSLPLSFSPDGSKIVLGAGSGKDDGKLCVFQAADGKTIWEDELSQRIAAPPVFAPDGKRLYVPLWDGRLHVAMLDAANGRVLIRDDAAGECLWRPSAPVLAGPHVRMAAVSGDVGKKTRRIDIYNFPAYNASRRTTQGTLQVDVEGVSTLGGVPI